MAEEFVRMNLALAVVIDSNVKTVMRKIDSVNQLILRKNLIIPDPKIKAFRDYIDRVASKVGLVAHFIDDMPCHTLQGETHCGTNVLRHPNRYVVRPKFLPPNWPPDQD